MCVRSTRVMIAKSLLNMHRIPNCRPLQCDALLRPSRPAVENLVYDLARASDNVLHELVRYRDRRRLQRNVTDRRPMALAGAPAYRNHEQDGPRDDGEKILLGRDPAIVKGDH